MKQEDRDLLYKALCMYLAYSENIEVVTDDGRFRVIGWEENYGIMLNTELYGVGAVPDYKLFLYKLEDLNDKLKEYTKNTYSFSSGVLRRKLILDEKGTMIDVEDLHHWSQYPLSVIEFYLKNHGDIWGLIDKGLALNKKDYE